MKHKESLSAYHHSGELLSSSIESDIIKVCDHPVVTNYTKSTQVAGGVMYECKKLSVFGTAYRPGHYLILPESTNEAFVFGKIVKLLVCEEYAYFLYERHIPTYCSKTDLWFVSKQKQPKTNRGIILSHQLPDFRPLEAYKMGEKQQLSISIRNYILQNY